MVDPGYPNEEGPLEKPAPEEESAVEGGGDGY